ncbi:MAG: lipopolysaccharide heptosyltransferase II [Candidatus Omnitrophota bacterium]
MDSGIARPGRILVYELNWLGDILFSFPLLRTLRNSFPGAHISCAVVPRYKELLANVPWVDSVYTLSDRTGIFSVFEKTVFIRKLQKDRFDMCFLLKPSRTKTLMAAMAGIPVRIGFEGKNAPLTEQVEMPEEKLHRAEQILTLAVPAGISRAESHYEYFVKDEDVKKTDKLLSSMGAGNRRIVALNPGGNWGSKRWPAENFVKLARMLLERFPDVEIMVTGAGKDLSLASAIASRAGSDRCYSMAGKTGLNELAALLKKSALMISADSGPLHLASAVGATTIAIFGPTSWKITGPRGTGKSIILSKKVSCEIPCYEAVCGKDYECMRLITAEEVFKAAELELLSQDERQ